MMQSTPSDLGGGRPGATSWCLGAFLFGRRELSLRRPDGGGQGRGDRWRWAEADNPGGGACLGHKKIRDAETADFLASVAAAVTGAGHDGVPVLFLAEIKLDMTGVDPGRCGSTLMSPEDEVAGLEGGEDGVLQSACGAGDKGEAFKLPEPEELFMGAAGWVDIHKFEQVGYGTGTIHAFGIGSTVEVGNGWMVFKKQERLFQQMLSFHRQAFWPDGNWTCF